MFMYLFVNMQTEGIFIEWRAEEILMLDGQNNADQEWAVIGSSLSVGYKPDRDSDACEFQSVLVFYLA